MAIEYSSACLLSKSMVGIAHPTNLILLVPRAFSPLLRLYQPDSRPYPLVQTANFPI